MLSNAYALSEQNGSPKKVVVVAANRLLLKDFDNPNLKNIHKIINNGCVGLISPNTSGYRSEYSALLTAGAGYPSRGGAYLRSIYNVDEKTSENISAEKVFKLRTGINPPIDSAVLINIALALQDNSKPYAFPKIGNTASAISKSGLVSCAIGNSDTYDLKIDRRVASLAINNEGIIDIGDVSSDNSIPISKMKAEDFLKPQADNLFSRVLKYIENASYVVVDFGNFERLYQYSSKMSDSVIKSEKAKALEDLDSFIGKLLSIEDKNITIILASFYPAFTPRWNDLTPIIIYNTQDPENGLAYSKSTKTAGMISASDIGPTVLHKLNIDIPKEMVGIPITSATGEISTVYTIAERVKLRDKIILPFLWVIAAISAVMLTLSGLIIAFNLKIKSLKLNLLRWAMLAVACFPCAMLLAVLFPALPIWYVMGFVVSIPAMLLVSFLIMKILPKNTFFPRDLTAVFFVSCLIIVIDLLFGSPLCKYAVPSYDQLKGFRNYGLGNEYAGFLISMAIITYLSFQKSSKIYFYCGVLLLVVVSFLIGLANLGANYGALVTWLFTMIMILIGINGGRICIKSIAAAGILSISIAFIFMFLSSSHAGRFWAMAGEMGWGYIVAVLAKKIGMNVSIASSNKAVTALMVFTPLLLLWFYKIHFKVKKMFEQSFIMLTSVKILLIGAIAA
ncbi:MAG: hypothetical protein SNJ70_11145, partial [Armatimonadota bacterium]